MRDDEDVWKDWEGKWLEDYITEGWQLLALAAVMALLFIISCSVWGEQCKNVF